MTTHIKSRSINVSTKEETVVYYTQVELDALESVQLATELPNAKATKVEAIKAHAGAKIVAQYPEWKQRNMIAYGLKLRDIKDVRAWTAEEQAEKAALDAAWDWVTLVRGQSGAAEALVLAATTVAEVEAVQVGE